MRRCFLLSMLWLLLFGGTAQSADRCGDFFDLMGDLTKNHGDVFDSFTFKTGGEGKSILLITKTADGKAVRHWALINRISNVTSFCVVGEGSQEGFGLLKSMHLSTSQDQYGMPGSGYPRCANGDDPMASIKVRMWANRELAESTILYTESATGPDYVYLMSQENSWIIIKTTKSEDRSTCYFARGEEMIFRPNARWNSLGERP